MFAADPDAMQSSVRARSALAGGQGGREPPCRALGAAAQLLATIMVLIVAVAPSATSTTTM